MKSQMKYQSTTPQNCTPHLVGSSCDERQQVCASLVVNQAPRDDIGGCAVMSVYRTFIR